MGKEREVFLRDWIDPDKMEEVEKQVNDLFAENPDEKITLFISSSGGNIDPAWAFYELIKGKKIPLITVARGRVCSAAMLVFMSGTKRKATQNSVFLIHPGAYRGEIFYLFKLNILKFISPRQYKEEIAWTKAIQEVEARILSEDSRVTPKEALKLVNKDFKIFGAEEAKRLGIIDEII